MTRSQYRSQLKTKKWFEFRAWILEYYGEKCFSCGKSERLQVHHRWYIDKRKAWEYNTKDMEIYCYKCHKLFHKEHAIKFYTADLKLKYKKFTK